MSRLAIIWLASTLAASSYAKTAIQDNYFCQSNNNQNYAIWIESSDEGQYAQVSYKITSGQPWQGVYNVPPGSLDKYEGCIDIKAGRSKTGDPTTWAVNMQSSKIYGCENQSTCYYKLATDTAGKTSDDDTPGDQNWAVSIPHGLWIQQGPHRYHCSGSTLINGIDPNDGQQHAFILSQGSYYDVNSSSHINDIWMWSNFDYELSANQTSSNSRYSLKCVTADEDGSSPQVTYMNLSQGKIDNYSKTERSSHMTFTPITGN